MSAIEFYQIAGELLHAFQPVYFTGAETQTKKEWAVEQFTTGRSRVMFISNRSGAGLDGLQHYCQHGVVGELDWSPQVHKQFFGRLRRPGQLGQVHAHYLHADWGSDPVLMEMLGVKTNQARGIHDPGVIQAARVSDDSRIKVLAASILG